MVSDTVLGAIIGVSGAVIGSLLTGIFNWLSTKQRVEAERENLEIRQQAETERRRGEQYLQQKVDVMMNVYAVLEETRRKYKQTADVAAFEAISQEDYSEVIELYRTYGQAMDRAALFLTEEQHKILLEVFKNLHEINSFLERQVENSEEADYSEFGLQKYNEKFDNAEEMLKSEINEPIKAMEDAQNRIQ